MADYVFAPVVQVHVMKVYLAVSCASVVMAIGAYLDRFFNIGIITPFIAGGLALILSFFLSEPRREALAKLAAVFFLGVSMNAGYVSGYEIDENFMIAVCLGVDLPFSCFSATAKLANHKVDLYTIALISSSLSTLIWLQLASSVFGGSTALFQHQLYGLLMLLIGRLALATHEMIVEAAGGVDNNYIRHAQDIFLEVYLIFTCLANFLLEKKPEEEEEEEK